MTVELDERRDVDVAHAVAIGEAEGLLADILAYAPDAAACHRILAGIDERHPPGFARTPVHLDLIVR